MTGRKRAKERERQRKESERRNAKASMATASTQPFPASPGSHQRAASHASLQSNSFHPAARSQNASPANSRPASPSSKPPHHGESAQGQTRTPKRSFEHHQPVASTSAVTIALPGPPSTSSSSSRERQASTQAEGSRSRDDLHASMPSLSLTPTTESSVTSKGKERQICAKCGLAMSGQFVRALGTVYHLDCFKCQVS